MLDRRRSLICVVALLAAPVAGRAQTVYDSTVFAGLTWREIGIFRGGRTVAVAGSAARPREYWMGTTGGGVFKSTDGGNTWAAAADKYFGGTIGAFGVSASNPDIVYVGTGEFPIRGNVSRGDGVFKTTDGGKTWTALGLAGTRQIARVRVHPANPDIVYVAAQGDPFGPSADRGVYKSTDGGKTWSKILFRNDSTGASDLILDPSNPDVLYATLWQVRRRPWTLTSGGAGSGIFKSTDAGAHWTELTRNPGLPTGLLGNMGITVSPAKPSRVWALIEADSGGVYRSDDGGATWSWINRDHKIRVRAWYYMKIYADPKDSNEIYATNVIFYRSKDGGRTFQQINVLHGDTHDLWIAPNDADRMIMGDDGGATVSINGGTTWSDQDFATAQFYHVATTNHFPYRVCGAQQDNSGVCGPSRWPGGIDRSQWYDVAGESGFIQARPDTPDVTFGGDNSGFLIRIDHRTNTGQVVNPWPDSPDGHPASEGRYRFQWTAPLLISPHDPNTMYIGGNRLFKTTNEGKSWTVVSPDLTRHDPATLGTSGGPITLDQTTAEYYATIFALAESPLVKGLIWVGSDDGLIHLTRDGGLHWAAVTPAGFGDFTRVSIIEPSHYAAGTAYVAANRYQMQDETPSIYKTTDYGKTWTKLVNGIPASEFVRSVREDPVRRGLLFASTERGVYVSFNDGALWQSLRRNLPIVPVHDLAIKDGDLIAATHGRSFWILDDISPLEQLGDSTMAAGGHLYRPRSPYRLDWGQSGGFGDNPAHPVGKNPPSGALIYYWVKAANQAITLDVLDSAGAVIRSFSSAQDSLARVDSLAGEATKKTRTDSLHQAGISDSTKVDSILGDSLKDDDKPWPHRPAAEPRLPNKAGLNRFAWDLRTPSAQSFWGNRDVSTNGPMVLPGRYRLRLKVGNETYVQPLVVRADPRGHATAAALAQQFRLLRQIRDTVHAATSTIVALRNARAQLDDRLPKLTGEAATRAQALRERLWAAEDSLYQGRLQDVEDELVYASRPVERIGSLFGMAESADGRPPQQVYDVFAMYAPALQKELQAARDALGAVSGAGLSITPGSVELRKPAPVGGKN
ncbi:MAG TPA: glycosyl hydrolase [Gemmatimonadales bacterium]|nr:glycosyl hydrolase [Gemmatimonadales bacterium]